eukprot:15449690-Alexandrium_andersonii.AAC.1
MWSAVSRASRCASMPGNCNRGAARPHRHIEGATAREAALGNVGEELVDEVHRLVDAVLREAVLGLVA